MKNQNNRKPIQFVMDPKNLKLLRKKPSNLDNLQKILLFFAITSLVFFLVLFLIDISSLDLNKTGSDSENKQFDVKSILVATYIFFWGVLALFLLISLFESIKAIFTMTSSNLLEIEQREKNEEEFVSNLAKYPKKELILLKNNINSFIDLGAKKLNIFFGSIEKLGIFPAVVALLLTGIKVQNDISWNSFYSYALAFFIGIYLGAFLVRYSAIKLEYIVNLIEKSIARKDFNSNFNLRKKCNMKKFKYFFLLPIFLIFPAILLAASFSATPVVKDLDITWGMVFLDKERLVFTQRSGEAGVLSLATGKVTWLNGLPVVYAEGQGGLLDVVPAPDFAKSKWLYFTYSKPTNLSAVTALARAQLRGNRLVNWQDLLVTKSETMEDIHFGSRIAFDDKGHVFFTVGDRGVRKNAQDLGVRGRCCV